MNKIKIAVFVSGGGTNLQSIIDNCESGKINTEVIVVVSNKANAYALERAKKHNIPTILIESKKYKDRNEHEREVIRQLDQYKPELLVFAGYMRLVSREFIKHYYNNERNLPGIINIHPALLPSFAGCDGYGDAFRYGVKHSGITVHFIDEGMDTGPIILQETFPRNPTDTLEDFKERGLKIEHKIFPQAIHLYATNKLKIEDRFVKILDE
ncbi:phosphoribosylglycinamide formyltransferase [candidate division KSB1 bacterium]